MRNRLWRAKHWLRYHLAAHALILMYHRVALLENDPHLLAVTPEHFAAHLEIMRQYGRPMLLSQLAHAVGNGHLPDRALVVTFDDGYADNLYHAKPLLRRFDIPATVFVVAAQLESRLEFWWDELDRLLLQPGMLPVSLQLEIGGKAHEWQLGQASEYGTADYFRDAAWHIECPQDPTPRHALFRELFSHVLGLTEDDRAGLFEQLRSWAGVEPAGRPTHRVLTAAELHSLAEDGLIDVGAHTMNHPLLAGLPAPQQAREVRDSKACLESVLQRPVSSFAYPNGSYTRETVSIVKGAGFDAACTSEADVIWQAVDPFQLPRLGVRDWDGATFQQWLSWWMRG